MAYYLWGNVKVAEKDQQSKSIKHKTLTAGTEVSKGDLINDEDWDTFLKLGTIRKTPFPDVRTGESVRSALLRKAREDYEAATAVGGPEAQVEQQLEESQNEDEEGEEQGNANPNNQSKKKPWE